MSNGQKTQTPTLNSLLQKPAVISAVQNPTLSTLTSLQQTQQNSFESTTNSASDLSTVGPPGGYSNNNIPNNSYPNNAWAFARFSNPTLAAGDANNGGKNIVTDPNQLKPIAAGPYSHQMAPGPFQPIQLRPFVPTPGDPVYYNVQQSYATQGNFGPGPPQPPPRAINTPPMRASFPVDGQEPRTNGLSSSKPSKSSVNVPSPNPPRTPANHEHQQPQHRVIANLKQETSNSVNDNRTSSPGVPLSTSPAGQMRHSPVSPVPITVYQPSGGAGYQNCYPSQPPTMGPMPPAVGQPMVFSTDNRFKFNSSGPQPVMPPTGYQLPYSGYPNPSNYVNGPVPPPTSAAPLTPRRTSPTRFRGPEPYRNPLPMGNAGPFFSPQPQQPALRAPSAFRTAAANGYPPMTNMTCDPQPSITLDHSRVNGRNTPNALDNRRTSTPAAIEQKPKMNSNAKESHPSTPAPNSPGDACSLVDDMESSLSSPSWPRTPNSMEKSSARHSSAVFQQHSTVAAAPQSSAGGHHGGKDNNMLTGSALVNRLLGDFRQNPYGYQEWEDRRLFYEHYVQFCDQNNLQMSGHPSVSKQIVDLYKLYKEIKKSGGYQKATKNKVWRELCAMFNINQSNSASGQLKKQYSKFLLPYECYYDLNKAEPGPIIKACESKKKHKPKNPKPPAAAQQQPTTSLQMPPNGNNAAPPATENQSLPLRNQQQPAPAPQQQISYQQLPTDGQAKETVTNPFDDCTIRIAQPQPAQPPLMQLPPPPPQGMVQYPSAVRPPPNPNYAAHFPTPAVPEPTYQQQKPPQDQVKQQQPQPPLPQWSSSDQPAPSQQPYAPYPSPATVVSPPNQYIVPPAAVLRTPLQAPSAPEIQQAQHLATPRFQQQQHYPAPISSNLLPISSSQTNSQPPPPTSTKDFLRMQQQQQQNSTSFFANFSRPSIDLLIKPPSSSLGRKDFQQISPFPSDSVEATTPKTLKRKKFAARDIGKVDAWRLVMALKSGLRFDTCWALNILTILLNDESTTGFFDLKTLPGLLDVLIDLFRRNLRRIFVDVDDEEENDKTTEEFSVAENADSISSESACCSADEKTIPFFVRYAADFTSKSRRGAPVRYENAGVDNFGNDDENQIRPTTPKKRRKNCEDKLKSLFSDDFSADSDEILTKFATPLAPDDDAADSAADDFRQSLNVCLTISNILRGLSFVGGNEIFLSTLRWYRFLGAQAKLLTYVHRHVTDDGSAKHRRRRRTLTVEEIEKIDGKTSTADDSADFSAAEVANFAETAEIGRTFKFYDELSTLADDAFVVLCNTSANLDLFEYDEKTAENLLSAVLHWAVCKSASAADPLSADASATPPYRYALEILCKLTVFERNVDLILATPPWSRVECLVERLASFLSMAEDVILREFAVVLLHAFCNISPEICVVAALRTSAVDNLLRFLEFADVEMHRVCQYNGMSSLRDNPEIIGTSVGMLRRAATILLCISKLPTCRRKFDGCEMRLINFTMSHLMDSRVGSTMAQVLYELQQDETGGSSPSATGGNNADKLTN